ncbi:hypothetical protein FSARC_12871 [Fusarium sarcochroum]|uniref:Glycoside hydrolase family 43 protein n=1 Tax=Fusarium sarcochroum TaxID=1208366 RepID=A0A8H4T5F6_9HYPO|nr:hypothetical protein FSARC_12871 [Fusarium sarcochroum]
MCIVETETLWFQSLCSTQNNVLGQAKKNLSMSKAINPIIPGFAPYPSTVLVNGTYFLVNSTFHMFPGLPVYASYDLVNWEHIGNALNRIGQVSLQKSFTKLHGPDEATTAAQGGLYAPSIRYRKGTSDIAQDSN